jgi:hypothetical protein
MQGLKRVVCEIEGSMEVGVEQVVVCRERAEMRRLKLKPGLGALRLTNYKVSKNDIRN